jgi:D-aspartate ligase
VGGSVSFGRTETPVVVVNCQLAALAIMRSLGPLGVPLYGVSGERSAPAMRSRYCRERFVVEFSEERPEAFLRGLLDVARRVGRKAILIPTSDETAQFVADHADALRDDFVFQDNPAATIRQLASKREMFELATMHGVPTPDTRFPKQLEDVLGYAERGPFPVMLKGIYGNRLQARGRKKMEMAHSREELLDAYRRMEDPEAPNLMIQEYIPGGDDQVYIFNGYFNRQSDCLVGFTGFKIRQFPVHVGCASLGECRWVEPVARTTVDFMKAIGYQGILDIGYRLDPRDGRYKVLDINPRVGQAFRLFVAENDHDVVKALYLDLTDQSQPPVVRREGRRWVIEDFDLISSLHYYQEGTLHLGQWLRSFKGVEELAWFSWRDPFPFLGMVGRFTKTFVIWLSKRLRGAT